MSADLSSARRIFVLVLVAVFVSDQASKLWLFYITDITTRQPIEINRFFNLVLVWNRGISYGLFQQGTELGRWALTLFKLAAGVGLSIWAWRSHEKWLVLGLGLIAGGALGNAIDRVLYGAVLDFAHFFWRGFSWYVFNVADAAIVVGVGFLLYDSFTTGRSAASEKS